MGARIDRLKQDVSAAKNRVRGSVNIIKKGGGLAKTVEELDAFNFRTRGLRKKKGLGTENLNFRKKKKPLELFTKKGGK